MSYQVRFEATPNPSTFKFVIDQPVSQHTVEYRDPNDTDSSPLARKLFGFPWVSAVMVGPDFVAVTKQDWVEWESLAEPLAELIREHLELGQAMYQELAQPHARASEIGADDSPTVALIKRVLNEEIRPAVAIDGGDIIFDRFDQGVVYLHMRGACSGCPSSTATLKLGIETRLKEAVPEIAEVVAV